LVTPAAVQQASELAVVFRAVHVKEEDANVTQD